MMSAFPRNVTAEANNMGNMAQASNNSNASKPTVTKGGVRRRLTVLPTKGGGSTTAAKPEPPVHAPMPTYSTSVVAPQQQQQQQQQVTTMASYGGHHVERPIMGGNVTRRPIGGGPRRHVPSSMAMGGGPVYGASPLALAHPVFSNPNILKAAPFVPSASPPLLGSDASEAGMKRYAECLMDDGTHSEPSTLNEQHPAVETAQRIPAPRASNFTAKALDDHNVRQAYVSKRIIEVQKSHATPQKPCSCVYCTDDSTHGQCVRNAPHMSTPKEAAAPTPIKEAGPATPARYVPVKGGPAPPTPMLDWTTTPTPAKKKLEDIPEEAPKSSARRCIFSDNTPRRAFPLSTGDVKDERTPEPKHETPIASFFSRGSAPPTRESTNTPHYNTTSPLAHSYPSPPVHNASSASPAAATTPTVLMVVGHNGRRQPVISGRVPPPDGAYIVFEGDRGEDMGRVVERTTLQAWRASSSSSEKSLPQMSRSATQQESIYWEGPLLDEGRTAADVCADIVRRLRLPMFVVSASFQLDRKKLTIFYESQQQRVDFRKLCVELHSTFKCRIWMERVE